ncbi:MAG: PTS lactose/cellobiose transporter subunit IIA [Candidatus Weimeria sp.]
MAEAGYSEEYEQICFQLITASGGAKSAYIGAIQKAREGRFDDAREMIKQGDEMLNQAHEPHADMVAKEAAGNGIPMTLILTHAEDQMMSTEVFKSMALEFIELYERLAANGLLTKDGKNA